MFVHNEHGGEAAIGKAMTIFDEAVQKLASWRPVPVMSLLADTVVEAEVAAEQQARGWGSWGGLFRNLAEALLKHVLCSFLAFLAKVANFHGTSREVSENPRTVFGPLFDPFSTHFRPFFDPFSTLFRPFFDLFQTEITGKVAQKSKKGPKRVRKGSEKGPKRVRKGSASPPPKKKRNFSLTQRHGKACLPKRRLKWQGPVPTKQQCMPLPWAFFPHK